MHTSRKLTHALLALVALVVLASAAMAQNIGPGALPGVNAMVSDQKAGSVLFYTYYQSSTSAGTNTRVNITNTNPVTSAFVHVFFQAACTPADAFICLTPSQTMSFTTLDYDPDSTGYIVAIAVDGGNAVVAGTGCPINFNWLIGDEYLRIAGGFTANLGAEAVAARYGVDGSRIDTCDANSLTAVLAFSGAASANNNDYDALGGVLAVDNFPSLLDNNAIRLIVQAPRGDFRAGASNTSVLFGVLYDEAEQPFSFTVNVTCQNPLVNFTGTNPGVPRILGGGLNQVVGIGRTGWMRFWDINTGNGLIGAVLINNTVSSTNSFSGGHTLHKLTLNTNNVITIPIFTPAC